MHIDKIFIIGLPRTGTTSVCSKCLELGFTVAHTAYTERTFSDAQVIADTPVFLDYPQLDNYYPNSRFIYLTREKQHWLPSIKQLLVRMHDNIVRGDGGFNPIIKRCYQEIFAPFTIQNITNDEFLSACYDRHQQAIANYFSASQSPLFTLNVSQTESFATLHHVLGLEKPIDSFERLNIGGKVTAWKDLTHANKIASTRNGKITALPY